MAVSVPQLSPREERDRWVLGLCGGLLLLVLALDSMTPIGYAEWALYLMPVALTVQQSRKWAPPAAAVVACVFSYLGWAASPLGANASVALINRLGGGLALLVLAWLIVSVIRQRETLLAASAMAAAVARVRLALTGELTPQQLADRVCASLCEVSGAQLGAVYRREGTSLLLKGGHAIDAASAPKELHIQDGVLGQVAQDGLARMLHPVQAGHLTVRTALGSSSPAYLFISPITVDSAPVGVVELGFLAAPREVNPQELLATLAESIGMVLRSALYRQRLESLLEENQRQGESLQAQQEELRVTNEELEEHARIQREAAARLETQQVELEQSNVQLEEQAQLLERQKLALQQAQHGLQAKADQLENASRYKSEFLANMSHELRTPLNSSLILSKLLADNKSNTLSPEQVKYAEAIHASNTDLLLLINDILDLAKIESGHLTLSIEPVSVPALMERIRSTFEPLTQQKRLTFAIDLASDVPSQIGTDAQRLMQILKNLLANAVKFTEQGEVRLQVRAVQGERIEFEVRDTGLGISPQQQQVIFEAFRQADGSTSRKFGGTGLGLSISRELAQRLGGEISVSSEPGVGSRFLLALPLNSPASVAAPAALDAFPLSPPVKQVRPRAVEPPTPVPVSAGLPEIGPVSSTVAASVGRVQDDRAQLRRPGRLILAVEDDPRFAQVLHELAHELDFDFVVAGTGSEALRLARELKPSGILLDVGLPDQSGLTVLERLKRDPATRHFPVHMMSAHERSQTAMELGAIGYVQKPAAREQLVEAIQGLQERLQRLVRRVLVVDEDEDMRANLVSLLQSNQVNIVAVDTVAAALEQLSGSTFDCVVMDLSLSDGSGEALLEKMAAHEEYAFPPVIVYTGRTLSGDEEHRLRRVSRSIILKGARSPERLLDEVTLFLHSVESSLPPEQQRLLSQARQRDSILDGRRILLAEDDVRNIFALSSVFEPLGAKLEIARNGVEALNRLEIPPAVDLVLMDIMMPEMDGITAMQRIRAKPEWSSLPIIALTAKAMSDDRERCLEAGANDYVAKPIDVDKLVSLCRVWMPK